MHPNFLFIPTLLGAVVLATLGFKVSSAPRKFLIIWSIIAALLAFPALLFVVYYGHILDKAAWFYAFRAVPFTELTAAGLGFGLGLIVGRLKCLPLLQNSATGRLLAPALVLFGAGLLMIPYIKPLVAPLEVPLQEKWSQGVSLQSTQATCGPSSAATLLRQFHIPSTERDLARECFSYRGGTENWYVARALQHHGLQTQYLITSPQPAMIPLHSIAGVQLGGVGGGGHFITMLGRSGASYIIGDPLFGRLILTPKKLHSKYYFTGFFLVVSKPSNGKALDS